MPLVVLSARNQAGLELRLVLHCPREQTGVRNGIEETAIHAIRGHESAWCDVFRFAHGQLIRLSGVPNGVRCPGVAILVGIWTHHSCCQTHHEVRTSHAGTGAGWLRPQFPAKSLRISWNICLAMTTSACR